MKGDPLVGGGIDPKDILTDADMREIVEKRPDGSVVVLPNVFTIGVTDLSKAVANLIDGPKRTRHAMEHECYLEAISLKLQWAELWLRLFWVAKNGGKIFERNDKRTFGVIVHSCEELGFDPSLARQLRAFNEKRIDGVHKYLLGAIDYVELKAVCDEYEGLETLVMKYVARQIGVPKKKL